MGGFYGIFPHNLLVGLFAPVFLFAVLALGLGVRRFWRDVTPATSGAPLSAPATAEATDAVLRLKYLDGGHGDGCHNEDDAYTLSRRRLHHFTFYGFMLCFAATSVATLYHYLLDMPPVRPAQPAQTAGRHWRREPGDWHGWPVAAEPAPPPAAWRCRAKNPWTAPSSPCCS